MENKTLFFLKNFFFKFNSAFLSDQLEERLKYNKSLQELFLYFRKRFIYYILSFSVFCFFLSKTPMFIQNTVNAFIKQQNIWNILGKFGFGSALFIAVIYLTKFMESVLLRDVDFFIGRVQIATRYLSRPSVVLQYENLQTSHMLKFGFAILAIIPIAVLYETLTLYLSAWILIPITINVLSFVTIGLLHNRNSRYLKKTKDHYEKDVNFFSSIERFLEQIRTLAFDGLLKKQILSFSENHSFLYQKIFENEILITGIKYCSVFLLFALNSALFLITVKADGFVNFLPIISISFLLSRYFLAFLQIFEFREGASSVFNFFKRMDALNFHLEPIALAKGEEENQNIISFENASFVKNNQVVFHQINQHLKQNLLISVIGSTHDERSNYLSACVGSLEQIGGKVYRPQNFEFLSKHSVFFEGSIRENIVQSHDFDQQYYHEVLKACALNNEIDLLPANDLTKVDQYGSNFAQSFLRKIAIARVVYAKASVNFFDDPFSELTQKDSAKIFFEAFQKLLAGTTRVFCTDRVEYAALSEDIILCRGGKIIEQGSHVSLIAYDSTYARLFYAGAENRRFEILQNYAKQEQDESIAPLRKTQLLSLPAQKALNHQIFGEQIFERFKNRLDKFSHFMKMFFPVFVSKNFYAFFTFLTLSIFTAVYSFYFIFQNFNLNFAAKTSALFLCFSLISCIAFSVMLIFYKNVYATCAYIIENMSKFYFANIITQGSRVSSQGLSGMSYFDWKKENILVVTGKFYRNLLNFLLIGFFCLSSLVFASTLPLKLLILGIFSVIVAVLFLHAFIKTRFFFDEINSESLNEKIQHAASQFFDSFNETQSKNMRAYLHERVQAKLYGFYFSRFADSKKPVSFFKTLGFYNLLQNYQIIETMISTIKAEPQGFKPKSIPLSWPTNPTIQFNDVKFNGEQEFGNSFIIPTNARFMYLTNSHAKRSLFIEKIRLSSPIRDGQIRIDGEDIALLNPTELRRRIGYISQASFIPFLSIREHIDPYGFYDDADVWEILNKVGLSQHVALLKRGLSTLMEQVPQEMQWSGEVTLFSFARCLLNQNKIICIDHIEVTEDIENKICNLIESECKNCTILFGSENEKFRNLCTMIYPECEGESSSSILGSGNNAIAVTNNEENEARNSPFTI